MICPNTGSTGGHSRICCQRALGDARRVVIQAENKRRDRVDVALRQSRSTAAYSAGLLKLLLTLARLAGSSDSMPMKIHLPPDAAIRSTSSSSRSRLALICPTQDSLRAGRDDVAQQRFGALHVDGEIVVHEEDGDLALRGARAFLQQQHFVHDALIGAEADGVAEESGHRAELAAVRAAAAAISIGMMWNVSQLMAVMPHDPAEEAGDAVELIEIELFPRDRG